MKNITTNLGSAALISFLLVLPFMILDFWFQIVNKPTALSLKNYTDFILLFGFLWLALAAIILILMPFVRGIRAGKTTMANPELTQGNAMTNILANPTSAAVISFILALPFVTVLSLASLDLEFVAYLLTNPDPDQPDVLGSLIVLGAFLLAVLGCIIARAPILRTMQAGGSLLAHPINLILAVVILSLVTMAVGGIIVDQLPCFLGVPNCD